MQTPNEQIAAYIDEVVQSVISFVTSSHMTQIELTIAGLCVMFTFIVYIVTKVINDVDSSEYIDFEHEEYED